MSKRAHIGLKVRLAAALLTFVRPDEHGKFARVISHEDAKKLTADQIIARFELDHYPIPKAFGGEDVPWNLEWRPKAEHRRITAKIDQPRIAKARRLTKAETARAALIAAEEGVLLIPKPRRLQKRGRKIQSQGFQRRRA